MQTAAKTFSVSVELATGTSFRIGALAESALIGMERAAAHCVTSLG
jgi:hypothetical protein